MKKISRSYYLTACFLCVFLLCSCKQEDKAGILKDKNVSFDPARRYDYSDIYVKRVVDGDTLLLENGERVRLIGIDTPEIHESAKLRRDAARAGQDEAAIKKLGQRSYGFTKKLIEGKRVSLEFDIDKRDKYNRLLAYVYLEDGTFVNAQIVKEGYASLLTFPPNVKYAELFSKLYKEARENKRGLWK